MHELRPYLNYRLRAARNPVAILAEYDQIQMGTKSATLLALRQRDELHLSPTRVAQIARFCPAVTTHDCICTFHFAVSIPFNSSQRHNANSATKPGSTVQGKALAASGGAMIPAKLLNK